MTANLLRRRVAPLAAIAALTVAGIPALLAPAQAGAHPRPPHASAPPGQVAYVQRPVITDSTVPQRTGAI
jgi:multidrug efflux pump subunit AcrA (membrane-fusion protein)